MEHGFRVLQKLIMLLPYLLVQLMTRGGDWAIQNLIIYTFNNWMAFIPAVALGTAFNLSSGYYLQNKLVFPAKSTEAASKIPNRFGTFAVLRGVYGVTAFFTLTILYRIWPESYWIYSGVITLSMWLLTYKSQRAVFEAKLRDLPRPVRRTREIVLRPKNTSRRIVRKITAVTAAFKTKRVRA